MNDGTSHSPYTASTLEAERRRRLRRLRLVAATATAAALLAGAVWTMSSGGGETVSDTTAAAGRSPDDIRETVETAPRTPEAALAVKYDVNGLTPGAYQSSLGTWATGRLLVKSLGRDITALDIDSGDQEWKLSFPGPVCGAAKHVTTDNRTAVAYSGKTMVGDDETSERNTGMPCDHVAFIDLDTGEKLWETGLPTNRAPVAAEITLTRGVVAVSWMGSSLGYDMDAGRLLWSRKEAASAAGCEDMGLAGGKGLLALRICRDGQVTYQVQKVDPRTGRGRWTYDVRKGIKGVKLVSASPPVLALEAGDTESHDINALIVLHDDGTLRSSITTNVDRYSTLCDPTARGLVETCDGVVVGERQLFIATRERLLVEETVKGEVSNEIVAYDLDTGKSGLKFDGRPGRPLYPLRMSGDRLIAYRQGGEFGPSAAVAIDPSSGKETLLLVFPATTESATGIRRYEDGYTGLMYEHGRFFLYVRSVQASTDEAEEGRETPIALGYGSTG